MQQLRPIAPAPGALSSHRHPEAFMLMRYASADWQVIESIWNSRDGYVPYTILNRDQSQLLNCVGRNHWIYQPNYRPQLGERVFVSHTAETAWATAERYVTQNWAKIAERYPDYVFRYSPGQIVAAEAKRIKVGLDPVLGLWTEEGWAL
jgi:hypothetical protein